MKGKEKSERSDWFLPAVLFLFFPPFSLHFMDPPPSLLTHSLMLLLLLLHSLLPSPFLTFSLLSSLLSIFFVWLWHAALSRPFHGDHSPPARALLWSPPPSSCFLSPPAEWVSDWPRERRERGAGRVGDLSFKPSFECALVQCQTACLYTMANVQTNQALMTQLGRFSPV